MEELETFTVYEIAKRFNVSPPTVYKWIEKGLKCETVPMSGTRTKTMINFGDVAKYIEENTK